MCGIVGFVGTEPFDLLKIKILYLYNETRGKDSSGVYIPGGGLVKVEGETSKNLLPYFKWPTGNLLLGHCRAATHGTKIAKNAHPFRKGDIVLVHNGSIPDWANVARKHNCWNTINVDSELMCHLMNQYKTVDGVATYIDETLKQLDGGIATLIYDKDKPNTLSFFRNKERPLFYGMEMKESGIQYYFSSIEESLLAIGISRENIIDVEPDYIYAITDNILSREKFVKPAKIVALPQTNTTTPAREETITTKKVINGVDYLSMFSSLRNMGLNKVNGVTSRHTSRVFVPDTQPGDYLAIGTSVEYTNKDGVKRRGIIAGCSTTKGEIYTIRSSSSIGLDFIHRDLICEIEEENNVPESVNIPMSELFKTLYSQEEFLKRKVYAENLKVYERVEYTNEEAQVKCGYIVAMPSFKDKSSDSCLVTVQIDDSSEPDDNEPTDIKLDVLKVRKSYKLNMKSKTESVETEVINENDEYDDASEMYEALIKEPGFDDEDGIFELLATTDIMLKNTVFLLKAGLAGDSEVTVIIRELYEKRGEILNQMICLAKQKEEDAIGE